MTDLEQYTGPPNGVAGWQTPAQQVVRVQPRTVAALTEWAQAAQAAYEVAQRLVTTSFVPEAFRDKPAEAAAAILAGDEVGLNPMAALRSFDIIQGTAAPRAMTQRAIVQAKGHEIWVAEATDTRAIVKGRRAGSTQVQESVWDLARARALNLLGKRNWKDQPKAMLTARATAECCRLVASDALLGIPYAVEEIADGDLRDPYRVDEPANEPRPASQRQPAGRTAQRRTQPKTPPTTSGRTPTPPPAEPEPAGPPLPGEDGYDEETASPAEDTGPPEDDRPANKPQLTKLGAYFTEHGIRDRDTRLAVVRALVRRPVESSADLTLPEASDLIEQLEAIADANGEHTGDMLIQIAESHEGAGGDR